MSAPTLWILEDNVDIAGMLTEMATGRRVKVLQLTTLAGAQQALARALASLGDGERPAGVISDLELPDGQSDAWLLRLRGIWGSLPLLCYSGNARLLECHHLRAAGIHLVQKGHRDSLKILRDFLDQLSTLGISR